MPSQPYPEWEAEKKDLLEQLAFLERALRKSKKLNEEYHTFLSSRKWLGGPTV